MIEMILWLAVAFVVGVIIGVITESKKTESVEMKWAKSFDDLHKKYLELKKRIYKDKNDKDEYE